MGNETMQLHYNITCSFNEKGKKLNSIIKEHFFMYLKELKKEKKLNE